MKKILTMTLALLFVCAMTLWAVPGFAAGPALDAGPTDAEPTYDAQAVQDAAEPSPAPEEAEPPTVAEAVGGVISAAVKLVLAAVTLILTKYIIPFAKNTVAPFIRETIIPWLKEHRLKALAESLVHGAEQLANSGQITKEEKLQYVLDALEAKGVKITPEVRMVVEGAVLDLDKTGKGLLAVMRELLEDLKAGLEVEGQPPVEPGAQVAPEATEAQATPTADTEPEPEARADAEA